MQTGPRTISHCLALWCADHGKYSALLGQALPDRRTLQPLGLAPLLQTLSTEIANAVRRRSLAMGEDVVIEATMASTLYGDRLLRSLAKADYSDLVIVSVETDLATAQDRAMERWWRGREVESLGGRLVHPEVIERAYPASTETSACRANAIRLLKTVREGSTTLDRASMIAYDDGVVVAVDADPPRAV
jgi:hypothetical protein